MVALPFSIYMLCHSYVLSFSAIILSIIHLAGVLIQDRDNALMTAEVATETPSSPQQNSEPNSSFLEVKDDPKYGQNQPSRKYA